MGRALHVRRSPHVVHSVAEAAEARSGKAEAPENEANVSTLVPRRVPGLESSADRNLPSLSALPKTLDVSIATVSGRFQIAPHVLGLTRSVAARISPGKA
jgi:hypothetical protein